MTATLDMIRGRSNIITMTNNSGGALVAGDVCVQDTTGDEYVTTTTSAASVLKVFVAAESIGIGATGKFYESGYCPLVNVNASVTRGRFLFTHTVAKQAAENAAWSGGAFGKILKSGTTPSAIIYSATAQVSGGAVRSGSTTDGHLAVWNGSNADSIKDGGVVAPIAAPYVTTASDASLSAEVVIPGLAGSADVKGVGGAGTSREFESGDTAPTWSPNAPAASDVGTTFPSHFYAQTTDTTYRYGLYAWAPAGDFDARAKCDVTLFAYTGTPDASVGLVVTNSDGSVKALTRILIHTFGGWVKRVEAFTYESSTFTQRGSSWTDSAQPMTYVRVTRVSGTFGFYFSFNGLLWTPIATQALTMTVANVGIFFSTETGNTDTRCVVDWLRTDV